jgi:hypothetical protein
VPMRLDRVRWSAAIVVCALLCLAVGVIAATKALRKPKTVVQVVTIRWTASASPELRRAALEGIEKLASEVPGVVGIWMRPLRVQPRDFMSAYALEFEDQAAAERFARHPAHDAWNRSFLYLVDESRTQQVTN